MARRVYGKNTKSDKLKNKTLQQIRDLREKLDPEVLSRIAESMSSAKSTSEIKVDRQKNRETILQALALREDASLEFLLGVEELISRNKR